MRERRGGLVSPRLSWHVVWRCAAYVLVASTDYEEVTVLHTCIEVYAFVGQMLVEKAYELVALLSLKASAGVVLEDVAFDANEITTHGEVSGLQLHPYAGGFERAAAFIDKMLVVAEDAAIGHFGTRMEAVGYGLEHTAAAVFGEPVHGGCGGMLEEGLAIKRRNVPVGHAVAKDDEVAMDPPPALPQREGVVTIIS